MCLPPPFRYVRIKCDSFFRSASLWSAEGWNFMLSRVAWYRLWSIASALLMAPVGPRVSFDWAGDIEPSASVSPASLPSGVAPVSAPPGACAVIEMAVGLTFPPQTLGNVPEVSAQNLYRSAAMESTYESPLPYFGADRNSLRISPNPFPCQFAARAAFSSAGVTFRSS